MPDSTRESPAFFILEGSSTKLTLNPTHTLNLLVAFGIKSAIKIVQFRFAGTLFRESHQKTMPIMVGGN